MRAWTGGWLLIATASGCERDVCGIAAVGGGELTMEVGQGQHGLDLQVPGVDTPSSEPREGAWMEIGPTDEDLTEIFADWTLGGGTLPCDSGGEVHVRLRLARGSEPSATAGELSLDQGDTRLMLASVFERWLPGSDRFTGSAELVGQWTGAVCPELGSAVPVRVSWSFSHERWAVDEQFYAGLPGSCEDRSFPEGPLLGLAAGGCPEVRVRGAPHDVVVSTIPAGDDFGACGGVGAPDVAIEFTADETGVYGFEMSDDSFLESVFAVFDHCGAPVRACDRDVLDLHLAKGQTVLVVVDGVGGQAGQAEVQVRRRAWSL